MSIIDIQDVGWRRRVAAARVLLPVETSDRRRSQYRLCQQAKVRTPCIAPPVLAASSSLA